VGIDRALKKIILATKSIDRKEIFERAQIPFIASSSDVDEAHYKEKFKDPVELVQILAKEKVLIIKRKKKKNFDDAIIIAADTIVEYKGEIMGKADNEREAFKILKKLMGKTHNLITGFAITALESEKLIIDYDITKVEFLTLSDNEIWNYINSGEWKGRAGAYSLRERAGLFVKSIDGSYSNVLGLPMQKVFQILKESFNLNLLKYIP
jgi:septum formation protein